MFAFFVCPRSGREETRQTLIRGICSPQFYQTVSKYGTLPKMRRFYLDIKRWRAGNVQLASATRDWFGK